ncbi:beta/gamma crystallin-related protein [Janthinobacterium sp. UMAB-56]|uniref:beta/gamma crystallin-related protein n=1 Tax=Janthinobacterium sp. UMAB-56 TaxID=1365361 RepID=UPI001C592720|nr:beta/gamma crystallin-related protein [Janthinobacterium sp. UMAB-56]
MNRPFTYALLCASSLFVHLAAQAGEIRLYTDDNFKGRVVVLRDTTDDLSRVNFNDTVSSIQVDSGSWEVCTDSQFNGSCERMGPGRYEVLNTVFEKRISSLRRLY